MKLSERMWEEAAGQEGNTAVLFLYYAIEVAKLERELDESILAQRNLPKMQGTWTRP